MNLSSAELATIHSALTKHVVDLDRTGDLYAREAGKHDIARAFHARAHAARVLADRVRDEQNRVEMSEHAAAYRERVAVR